MFRSNKLSIIQLSLIFSLSFSALYSHAQLRVAKIFSDNMVLQRDQFVKVWGWSEPGDKISVEFMENQYEGLCNKAGEWNVTLPKMEAGGPYSMRIATEDHNIEFVNILIGDVWLCSGQSNMEWPLSLANNPEEEIANANDSGIRHFKVPLTYSDAPQDELAGGEWFDCTPENAGAFTAVGYFFAKNMRTHHNVPIGLLNSSWGGSRIEPWMRAELLSKNGENPAKQIIKEARERSEQLKAEIEKITGPLSEEDKGTVNGKAVWASPKIGHDDWMNMELPNLWEADKLHGFDGIVWFRKNIELTAADIENGVKLSLAKIDDSDITYINGKEVGQMINQYASIRNYTVPSEVLVEGTNTIAVRVEDTGGGGGIYGDPNDLFVQVGNDKRSLAGDWKYKPSAISTSSNIAPNQIPTLLYNKMIHPIIGFPIKGVLWYQGESNAGGDDAYVYRDLFADMIHDWRKLWGVGEFPFLWVQLANFMAADDKPAESDWAVLRESQTATLAVPNTAQAVIIDIGEANDIHPRNKQDVGYRLSLAARKLAFGENMLYSGPNYKSHEIKKNKILISFTSVGSALEAKDKYGYLKGFSICGPDGKYVWARAKILGNKVEVWSPEINIPVGLRYAWGNNPDDANLYNREGLPATPFRVDKL